MLITPFDGWPLVNVGACALPPVLVSAKIALPAPAATTTENDPLTPFAVKVGALVTPEAAVNACATVPPEAKVPEAPVADALKVTTALATELFALSRARTVNSIA